MMGNNLPQLPTLSTTRSLPRDPCRICLCTCRPIPLDGAGYLTYSLLSSQQGRMYYPLVNVYITNWKITMLLMAKSTSFLWPFSMSQTVKLPEGTVPWDCFVLSWNIRCFSSEAFFPVRVRRPRNVETVETPYSLPIAGNVL